jgi:hypothetical protein
MPGREKGNNGIKKIRWRVHCGAPTVEEQSEQAKPDLFDHLAKHPDTVMAKEEQTNTIGE